MKTNSRLLALLALVLASACGFAQDKAKEDPIDTERPDFTNSPIALGYRMVQLEFGASYARAGSARSFDGPEALLRYGFHPTWEFQLGLPNFTHVHDEGGNSSGYGDTTLALKHQWTSSGAPVDFGTTFYATAPTAKDGFGSGAWDGGVLFMAGRDLGHNWSVGAMLQLDQVTQDGAKNSQAFASVSFGFQYDEKTQPFFELAALSQRHGDQQAYFQTGFLFRTDPTHQWDLHAAARLDSNQSFSNIGVGYSVRF